MHNSTIDQYASHLTQLCLPTPAYRDDPAAHPSLEETRPIIERWVNAPGWGEHPLEERAEMLLKFVKHLSKLLGDRPPIEWLVFPFNAVISLQERASQASANQQIDRRCANALQCYALTLQNAGKLLGGILNEQDPDAFFANCNSDSTFGQPPLT